MKTKFFRNGFMVCISVFMITLFIQSKTMASNIKEETVSYSAKGITFKGFVAYDESIKGKRPVILVVHEWWGLTDYPKMRARQLAELGYLAFAVDMFGDGKTAPDPKVAQALTGPFYNDPGLIKTIAGCRCQKGL